MADVQVLARISGARFWRLPEALRDEIRVWLLANDVDPDVVLARSWDAVEVVLLDAPMIVRREHATGRAQLDERGELRTRAVQSLLRVPLPEHLADPALGARGDR